ncbi:MAG TPA: cadmium-translocating P-type ATPase [Planctomycetaceae bacterium]|nr:cadmium-translocating P-type ATPase [Planctomycetaceae bacterium]HRF02892.1 heavy metal translocating P-type ATPase [Pirellulaceae bacterium]
MAAERRWYATAEGAIALGAVIAIALHLVLASFLPDPAWIRQLPLWFALAGGGGPLVFGLVRKLLRAEFGSDLLAGLSICVSVVLGEYLAGTLVVLMLSGGETLENYAVRSASSVLRALAKRMPTVAHRLPDPESPFEDVPLESIAIGDRLVILPHEVAPVDGTVVAGHGVMDESYLTGEPYRMSKTPGSQVLSGAINGESALTIRADRRAEESRYARIMQVMRTSEEHRPQIRRLADRLGAFYTPLAVAVAAIAWMVSGDPIRFLAVLVVATPCPLLIAIPVAVIGSISLAAKRAIIIRNPSALEVVDTCRTMIFDKTGTLTYGEPTLSAEFVSPDLKRERLLQLAGSVERYSKHPLAKAVVLAADAAHVTALPVSEISERPGEGLTGTVDGRRVRITNRKGAAKVDPRAAELLPAASAGLECVVLVDDRYAGLLQFRDAPRKASASFVRHLGPRHHIARTMLVSGDRESEVKYLAELVGIDQVLAGQSPEQKLEIVRRETLEGGTVFVGDGINDAPALTAATVGIAFGQNSDVTTEAADIVIMDSSIEKVDEFLHIGRRMRRIALQSAVGGMAASIVAMGIAAAGLLHPVGGAIVQEVIDVVAVLNALRVAIVPSSLRDFEP